MKVKSAKKSDIYTPLKYDACQSPPYAIDPLLPYIPTDKIIWECASGADHMMVHALQNKGYTVIHSDLLYGQNFFEYEPDERYDVIVTNPPFSLKYKWIKRCLEIGKPFALLLPGETTYSGTFLNLWTEYDFQIIAPNRRINFNMPNKGWRGTAQFPVAWFTLGLDLPKQVNVYDLPLDVIKSFRDSVLETKGEAIDIVIDTENDTVLEFDDDDNPYKDYNPYKGFDD